MLGQALIAQPLVWNIELTDINTYFSEFSDQILVYELQVINGEIFNVLNTTIGEEVFEPEYGSYVPHRLFEPCDDITAFKLTGDIREALARWVPQIIINRQLTRATAYPERRAFDFHIVYEYYERQVSGLFKAEATANGI